MRLQTNPDVIPLRRKRPGRHTLSHAGLGRGIVELVLAATAFAMAFGVASAC